MCFLKIFFLKVCRRLVIQSHVRTGFVVEANEIIYTFPKSSFRGVLSAVRLFFFEGSEEALRDGVVMGAPAGGEGLGHVARPEQLSKRLRGILLATVTVEGEIFGLFTLCKCRLEGRRYQLCAGILGDAIPDNPPGEQVEDGAKIQIFPANFETRNVTDPELVRAFRCEVAFKDIPLFLSLSLDPLFLRVRSYAVQVKSAHKCGYAFRTDMNSRFKQLSPYLSGSKSLTAVVENLLNQQHKFCFILQLCSLVSTAEDMIIEGPPCNVHSLADRMYAVPRF